MTTTTASEGGVVVAASRSSRAVGSAGRIKRGAGCGVGPAGVQVIGEDAGGAVLEEGGGVDRVVVVGGAVAVVI